APPGFSSRRGRCLSTCRETTRRASSVLLPSVALHCGIGCEDNRGCRITFRLLRASRRITRRIVFNLSFDRTAPAFDQPLLCIRRALHLAALSFDRDCRTLGAAKR